MYIYMCYNIYIIDRNTYVSISSSIYPNGSASLGNHG